MKGGSQSILVQCEDGRYYIVKMTDNPQGPNVLANELLASLLGSAARLPVAKGASFTCRTCSSTMLAGYGLRRGTEYVVLKPDCITEADLSVAQRLVYWIILEY
jgi:hypothetical protein